MSHTVAKVMFEGRELSFLIDNKADHIQAFHANGLFYEIRQLLYHRDLIPRWTTVLDVGANVGNHTLFYANYTDAKMIYCFEPNPKARSILEYNINLNSSSKNKICRDYINYGISNKPSRLQIFSGPDNNLGATRLVPGLGAADEETIECVRIDDLAIDGHVSFIKIDVEGMEMDALSGAKSTIEKFRPVIAIEISESNEPAFWEWVKISRYSVVGAFFDYLHLKNYVLIPEA